VRPAHVPRLDEHRSPLPLRDVYQRFAHRALERVHLERLGRVHKVDHVVADLSLLGCRGFGRADVHPPVHLHGVDRHQLDVGERPGQGQCEG